MHIVDENSEELKLKKIKKNSFFQAIKALFSPKAAFEYRLGDLVSSFDVYDCAMFGLTDEVKKYIDNGFDVNTQKTEWKGMMYLE